RRGLLPIWPRHPMATARRARGTGRGGRRSPQPVYAGHAPPPRGGRLGRPVRREPSGVRPPPRAGPAVLLWPARRGAGPTPAAEGDYRMSGSRSNAGRPFPDRAVRSLLLGLTAFCTAAGTARTAGMEWVEVAKNKKRFVLASSGTPFVPRGFNYDHDE